MSNKAWVTLATNDSYGLGALVLAHSLRQAGSQYPAVVLITPTVTEAMRERLRAVFAEVVIVDVLDSRDATHLALLQRPELGITFTKIHCWNLTQYEKCVFLDADTLVVQNCDELFEREELSAAPDVGWPDCFNSGVFVFSPSAETFSRLVAFAQERGSFDGGDQGLLNSFFSDWAHGDINKHLPFLYNVTSAAFYSYLPALKHYGQNLKIIHFIGTAKPWLQHFNFESRTVDAPDHIRGLLQLWWDIFASQVHTQLDTSMVEVEEPPPETPPPVLPPQDVNQHHHYRPVLDPDSEFPWHRPDAQIDEELLFEPHIDITDVHDPWKMYRGHIPPIPNENEQVSSKGVVENREEIRQYAWDYLHQEHNTVSTHYQEPQYEHWSPPIQHYVPERNVNPQHYDPFYQSEQSNHDHSQYHSDSQSHSFQHTDQSQYNQEHWHQDSHSYDNHSFYEHQQNEDNHDHSHHHQKFDEQYHEQSSQSHYTHEQPSKDNLNIFHTEYQPYTHTHAHYEHIQNHKENIINHPDIHTQTQTVEVTHVHTQPKKKQNRRPKLKIDHAFETNGMMNGDLSDTESEFYEEIIPRHPYDGFYLRHIATIDSRGKKICSHEIPPTPSPSPTPPDSPALQDYVTADENYPTDDEDQSGVAGNLARVVPGASSHEALDDLTRRQGWEAGNIDYLGADSFDKIWAKISQTLSQPRGSPPKESSPPVAAPTSAPEAPKESEVVEEAKEAIPVETPTVPEPVVAPVTEAPPAISPVQVATPVVEPVPVTEVKEASGTPSADIPVVEPVKVAEPALEPVQVATKQVASQAPTAPIPVTEPVKDAAPVHAPEAPSAEIPAPAPVEVSKVTEPEVQKAPAAEKPVEPVVEKPVEKIAEPVVEPKKTESEQKVEPPQPQKKEAKVAEAPKVVEKPVASPVASDDIPIKLVAATPEAANVPTTTDSPPLANTPSKEEPPAVPAAKSEEKDRRGRKPAGKLQLQPPAAADPLPTPDSELEDADTLAGAIIASELRTPLVTSPDAPPSESIIPTPEPKHLNVDKPEVPTPPIGAVSLAQIGVKPKEKPTIAAQIESSIAAAAVPQSPVAATPQSPTAATPQSPTAATPQSPSAAAPQSPTAATPQSPIAATPQSPAATPQSPASDTPAPVPAAETPKKKVVKKVAKKDGAAAASGDAPVPPPRKKEKKPKEK